MKLVKQYQINQIALLLTRTYNIIPSENIGTLIIFH